LTRKPFRKSPITEELARNNHWINYFQDRKSRSEKYHLAKALGANEDQARRMRDWRLSKIERRFGLQPVGAPRNPDDVEARLEAMFETNLDLV
jgi:hypothetical protein